MNKLNKILIVGTTIVCVGCASVLGFFYLKSLEDQKVGEKAVKLMYDFDSYSEVYQEHMKGLQEITTEPIYKNITVTNVDRALTTYLKFKGHPSKVNILQKTDKYVIYTLDTESITQTRKFAMFYHVNIWGKIDNMQECELRDFYQANTSGVDD